jgi:hypothetical protein
MPSLDLMHELLRRMKCSSKLDKHLILIGTGGPPLLPPRRQRRRLRAVPGAAGRARLRLAAVHSLDPPYFPRNLGYFFFENLNLGYFPISLLAFMEKKR